VARQRVSRPDPCHDRCAIGTDVEPASGNVGLRRSGAQVRQCKSRPRPTDTLGLPTLRTSCTTGSTTTCARQTPAPHVEQTPMAAVVRSDSTRQSKQFTDLSSHDRGRSAKRLHDSSPVRLRRGRRQRHQRPFQRRHELRRGDVSRISRRAHRFPQARSPSYAQVAGVPVQHAPTETCHDCVGPRMTAKDGHSPGWEVPQLDESVAPQEAWLSCPQGQEPSARSAVQAVAALAGSIASGHCTRPPPRCKRLSTAGPGSAASERLPLKHESDSEVSRICAGLDEEVGAFRDRQLDETAFPNPAALLRLAGAGPVGAQTMGRRGPPPPARLATSSGAPRRSPCGGSGRCGASRTTTGVGATTVTGGVEAR
jgi:hypothetical protein